MHHPCYAYKCNTNKHLFCIKKSKFFAVGIGWLSGSGFGHVRKVTAAKKRHQEQRAVCGREELI
jgi:hypothetical protein